MNREERIQAYMDSVVYYCKGNSERIVSLCTNNIKMYTSVTPHSDRAKETTNIRIEALTRLLDKYRQLELFKL